MSLNEEQKPPEPGDAKPTWELVIDDMKERDATGARKYGVRHQHDNGRDHLVDQYQELLDAAVYTRAEIERRKALRALLDSIEYRVHEISVNYPDKALLNLIGQAQELAR